MTTPTTFIWRSIAILSCLLLFACSSGSNNPVQAPDPVATQDIVVAPSLGRINRGIARAFSLNGNPLSDPVTLDANGTAIVQIPATHDEPLLIEVSGADDADYFDEAANSTVLYPADQRIRALLPGPRDEVGVSILTELAVRLAEASGEDIDLDIIELANERIRAALAEDVSDLLTPPVIVDGSTATGDLDDDDAGRLAARLGALAMLAEGDATPALTILRQLAEDVADGNIDGNGVEGPIEGLTYDPATFSADFIAAIQAFAAAFGTEALQTRAASAMPQTSIGSIVRPGSNVPATINPGLVGDYLLTYFEAEAGGPFMEGETVMVIVGDDNTLQVGDLLLQDPYHLVQNDGFVFATEIIWLDDATGIAYALSNNETGVFNDLNLGDTTQPQPSGFPLFLGQLFEDESGNDLACGAIGVFGQSRPGTGAGLLATCAGTYEVLRVQQGEHIRMTVTIDDSGNVDFDTGVSAAAADITSLSDQVSGTRSGFFVGFAADLGEVNQISVYPASGGGIRDISANILGTPSTLVRVSMLPELDASEADGSDLPAGDVIGATIGDNPVVTTEPIGGNSSILASETATTFSLMGNDGLQVNGSSWQLVNIPKETGTFHCSPATMLGIRVNLPTAVGRAGGNLGNDTSDGSGRCTMVIESIELDGSGDLQAVTGTFSAELLRGFDAVALPTVTDGFFRFSAAME